MAWLAGWPPIAWVTGTAGLWRGFLQNGLSRIGDTVSLMLVCANRKVF